MSDRRKLNEELEGWRLHAGHCRQGVRAMTAPHPGHYRARVICEEKE